MPSTVVRSRAAASAGLRKQGSAARSVTGAWGGSEGRLLTLQAKLIDEALTTATQAKMR